MAKNTYFSIKYYKRTAILIALVLFLFSFNATPVYANASAFKIYAGNRAYEFCDAEIATIDGVKTLKCIDQVIDGIYLDTVKRPLNADVTYSTETSSFVVTGEKNGYSINKEELKKQVVTALNNNKKEVSAKFYTVLPTITKSEAESLTNMRSRFTTYYSNSIENRKHNILVATEKLNGYKIEPKTEFSFNQVVGLRTEENGFKMAKIILNGDFVDGVGGGVCQVSTTLYNSALLAGLKITEQHSHSLQVSYVEPSFDAMVNSFSSDLKFFNDTNYPMFIVAKADGNALSIAIYGKEQFEKYERVSVITGEVLPTEIEKEEDVTMLKGTVKEVRKAKNGITSEGYLIVYNGETRVKNLKIRSDSYKAINSKILVGTL
ncbi:MAG: VanW family protein [Clostridia bacterium]|nr:VanW family protein [Clostridia bacterium]